MGSRGRCKIRRNGAIEKIQKLHPTTGTSNFMTSYLIHAKSKLYMFRCIRVLSRIGIRPRKTQIWNPLKTAENYENEIPKIGATRFEETEQRKQSKSLSPTTRSKRPIVTNFKMQRKQFQWLM